MKKLLVPIAIAFVVSLSGCGNDEVKEAQENLEKAKERRAEVERIGEEQEKTAELIEELAEEVGVIDYEKVLHDNIVTDNISMTNYSDDGGHILVDVITDDDLLSYEEIYQRASDALLEYDDWITLTIIFNDEKMITMSPATSSEYNEYNEKYFPLDKIKENVEDVTW